MASEEHKKLAQFLKNVHASLRLSSQQLGADRAWDEHCTNTEVLQEYARCMQKLACEHWEINCADQNKPANSRIEWAANICQDYFINKTYKDYREKEAVIAAKINIEIGRENFSDKPKLIDVGSCYNPFRVFDFLDVFAVDLCPANDMVLKCDFLKVDIGIESKISKKKVLKLQESSFEIVTFCFVLEYIPSPELRISACKKAYMLLKPGGLLIINTPDSKHVGANCKIMKCWRYALALMGFTRIKYDKYAHMHCMAFRKSMNKKTAVRWAELHQKPYMEYTLNIPQDGNVDNINTQEPQNSNMKNSENYFSEMPFCE